MKDILPTIIPKTSFSKALRLKKNKEKIPNKKQG
jgi:hypothetical protein